MHLKIRIAPYGVWEIHLLKRWMLQRTRRDSNSRPLVLSTHFVLLGVTCYPVSDFPLRKSIFVLIRPLAIRRLRMVF